MKIWLVTLGLVAAFAVGGGLALADGSPSSATTSTGVSTGADISGPCDEPEHANDPRCTGQPAPAGTDRDEPGEDISGPCDEAEHANDPRCTGQSTPGGDDDNRGPGGGDEDNSGHRNGGGEDNSGPGGGDEDNSGPDADNRDSGNSGSSGPGQSGSGGESRR